MKYDPWKVQEVLDELYYKFNPNAHKGSLNMFSWDEIQDIFLISDTHFCHTKIAEYCDRPENWQELIIKNWNSVVSKDDTVLHLGDYSLGRRDVTEEITNRLNGTIYLIGGNHDRHGKSWYGSMGITKIGPFAVQNNYDIVYFTHRPIRDQKFSGYNFSGHMHQKSPLIWEENDTSKHINVSVEQLHYKPRKFKELFPMLKRGGLHLKEEMI